MHSRRHISFSLILFIFLMLITWWLDQITRPPEQTKDSDLYQNPDYIVENLSGIRMEHAATARRRFTAEKLFHYIDTNEQMQGCN